MSADLKVCLHPEHMQTLEYVRTEGIVMSVVLVPVHCTIMLECIMQTNQPDLWGIIGVYYWVKDCTENLRNNRSTKTF